MSRDDIDLERLREGFASLAGPPAAVGDCPEAVSIWRAVMGELPAAEAGKFVAHSAHCTSCATAWRLARAIAEEAGLPIAGSGFSERTAAGRLRPAWWLAGAALIVLTVGALLMTRQAEIDPWRRIVVAKAAWSAPASPGDEILWRDAPPESIAEAMRPYEIDDFAAAERNLAAFLLKHPGHAEASFYRGVCLLLIGRPAASVDPLTTASLGADSSLRQESLWYLALATARQGGHEEAILRLRGIARSASPHREEAMRLLELVGAAVTSAEP